LIFVMLLMVNCSRSTLQSEISPVSDQPSPFLHRDISSAQGQGKRTNNSGNRLGSTFVQHWSSSFPLFESHLEDPELTFTFVPIARRAESCRTTVTLVGTRSGLPVNEHVVSVEATF
jgi:hypothetical protein